MYGQNAYYPAPAMQSAQQRLQMMEAQYPQFANNGMGYTAQNTYAQPTQQNPQTTILKGRPVSNKEEANAAMIDYDGSMFVFPDKAHGKIYTKQLGMDGNIVFLEYSLDMGNQAQSPQMVPAPVTPVIDPNEYVKANDLDEQMSGIQDRLSTIEKRLSINTNKGGNKA